MLYFEKDSLVATLSGLIPGASYKLQWFNPRDGSWQGESKTIASENSTGSFLLPQFPDGQKISENDWGLKLKLIK
jgi:hypothetical protein